MKFKIGFEKEDAKTLHTYWDQIISTERWSEGIYTERFEEKWAEYVGTEYAVAFSSWFGAAMASLEYFGLKDESVVCPSNTFMATPLAVVKSGGRVLFCDCNRYDLCMSEAYLHSIFRRWSPKAVFLVHIGGHIAFDVEIIARMCKNHNAILLEDCAHAHGASWNNKRAGTYGDVGIYSFYATKTISTGEGGMLVTDNKKLAKFAKEYRNYGKPNYHVSGGNYRMSEFTAALGVIQTNRLDDIVNWKNEYVRRHFDKLYRGIHFPNGMTSGYYKYIVFDYLCDSTGKVYDESCHRTMKQQIDLPNTDWVARSHWCVPIYYKGDD